MEYTFGMIKPDAFEKAEAITKIIENAGFTVVEKETLTLSPEKAKSFYVEHKDRPFFDDLVDFMSSGPCQVMVLAKENAVSEWRSLLGPTNSKQAQIEAPDSIRAKFGTDVQRNAAHGSDSALAAEREIKFFFPAFDFARIAGPSSGAKAKEYLMMNVVPTLTAGLTKMCKLSERPGDPLQWLSDYLRDNNPERLKRPKVFFVLGGPGAGKGTQCAKIVEEFGFDHFSAGDLLREAAKADTEQGKMVKKMLTDGAIVPGEITLDLLRQAIETSKKQGVLIDGFPRKLDQAGAFEATVSSFEFVLFFDCPEKVMEERLLKRGETSGRSDDNAESILKRFRTFVETSMPVVEYYEAKGQVKRIDAARSPEEVYDQVRTIFRALNDKYRDRISTGSVGTTNVGTIASEATGAPN